MKGEQNLGFGQFNVEEMDNDFEREKEDNLEKEVDLDLAKKAREIEKEMFEKLRENDLGLHNEEGSYFYYTPSHHFRSGLINRRIIKYLEEGADLISFGAGKAMLEEVLVKGFGIDKKRIAITDKNKDDFPDYLEGYEFNFSKDWPDFKRKFDFIIFPESFVAFMSSKRSFVGEGDSERNNEIVKVIKKCFTILKKGGQIRVNGHICRSDEIYFIKRALEKEGITVLHNKKLLIIEKKKEE